MGQEERLSLELKQQPGDDMHEAASDVARLQRLLGASYENAGPHLRQIHDQWRIPATEVCAELNGVCVLNLGTFSSDGRPVHGRAHEIDSSTGEFEHLPDYCREIYGEGYDSWGFWGKEPFAWIEPDRLFAIRIRTEQG
ncbi:MAG: hypothetical protein O3A63_11155 [Proteobacteria bacterium]|nr:hypothetical protein [Pseudomonadota bacterium]